MSDDLAEMAKDTKQRPNKAPGSVGGGKSKGGGKEPPGKPASQTSPYGPKDDGKKKGK